ncbi:hypothetical protein B0T17DRAFT_595073 [Bombardia bombarda]|uniref:Uncharacterized protein n=1 Tax=Bombardia bombarda TaxID=252184 RepID=A0AA39XKL0_9PEZI|nr:hypothetical protein B0T17DRAFT_595073 [Bombardia bombarda]
MCPSVHCGAAFVSMATECRLLEGVYCAIPLIAVEPQQTRRMDVQRVVVDQHRYCQWLHMVSTQSPPSKVSVTRVSTWVRRRVLSAAGRQGFSGDRGERACEEIGPSLQDGQAGRGSKRGHWKVIETESVKACDSVFQRLWNGNRYVMSHVARLFQDQKFCRGRVKANIRC